MTDPERASPGWDYLSTGFDRSGDAIAYYTGHGACSSGGSPDQGLVPAQTCTASYQCTNPVAGTVGPGRCANLAPLFPGVTNKCQYRYTHYAAVCGNTNYYGHLVSYSSGAPVAARMALGESSSSGGWAGAGTNGGVNLAILDISCGAHPGLEVYDMGGLFAGVQLVGTVWIRGGDTANVADRGSWFATNALADLNGSVSYDWAFTVFQITAGLACPNAPGGMPGPATGINGCGAMVMMSRESTLQRAYDKIKFASWLTIRDDTNDAQGNGYYEYRRMANWDMTQAPAVLP